MLKELIPKVGFNAAVRYVAVVVSITAIISFLLASPNPEHVYRKPDSWFKVRVWIDTNAFREKAFVWLTAGIAIMFFGFYAIFFNLEEVSRRLPNI